MHSRHFTTPLSGTHPIHSQTLDTYGPHLHVCETSGRNRSTWRTTSRAERAHFTQSDPTPSCLVIFPLLSPALHVWGPPWSVPGQQRQRRVVPIPLQGLLQRGGAHVGRRGPAGRRGAARPQQRRHGGEGGVLQVRFLMFS